MKPRHERSDSVKERIRILAEKTKNGEMYIDPTPTQYDRKDLFLTPVAMSAKRAYEYILNQTPFVNEYTALTGYLRFDGSVEGDIFGRSGHANFHEMLKYFYNQPVDGLCTFEWQHSVADYEKVIRVGIRGLKSEIAESRKTHSESADIEFLDALSLIADAIIGWAGKCSDAALEKSKTVDEPEYKENLLKLSAALKNVPENPAQSFYEAVLCVFVIYAFVPDSIGCIDRYIYPFYKNDIEKGVLTKEDAKAYLQELFLMLQARIPLSSDRFYRGGESHFCIGGYLENGEDGFNELSRLVLDSMLELPTWIPQISLRVTKKTPDEVFRYAMECERRDPNKRIAFVNDEPRIKALVGIGFPYEIACKYTMVGCNEPQLPGGIFMGGCAANIVKSVESTFKNREKDVLASQSFDEFYAIFEEELFSTCDKIVDIYNKFQSVRSRDTNLVSTMFFEGSISRAKSITQGGAINAVADLSVMGITTVIDSLVCVKQFVFDEKLFTMQEMCDALKADWQGFEEMRTVILKKAKFFGNNDDVPNDCAARFAKSLGTYFSDKTSDLGYKYVLGNLIGYNQHNKWFGDATCATPDGRGDGDIVSFGLGQSEGKDREGLTSLLSAVAKLNVENPILCGDSVTNILLDEQMVTNDDNFEKLVGLLRTYFEMGGMHFQLSYVSKEDLRNAKIDPQKYKSLRVRVSGFSDYFIFLNDDLQDEIITRTEKNR